VRFRRDGALGSFTSLASFHDFQFELTPIRNVFDLPCDIARERNQFSPRDRAEILFGIWPAQHCGKFQAKAAVVIDGSDFCHSQRYQPGAVPVAAYPSSLRAIDLHDSSSGQMRQKLPSAWRTMTLPKSLVATIADGSRPVQPHELRITSSMKDDLSLVFR
jgi:hypothetical protein